MTTFPLRLWFLWLLLSTAGFSHAQKNIVISDSLAANADKLNVKMGTQGFGKIWKFRFGDYAVVSSKAGWTTTSRKSNFFNTKTESASKEKFSFTLAGKTTDTARVNAVNNIQVEALQEVGITPHFSVGSNEVLLDAHNFSAFITVNNDTSDLWSLFMNTAVGSNTDSKYEAFLTNGERKILIAPTTSNKNGGDSRSQPALGYEFIENGKSLGAVQYYGGGMLGMNKNMVWIDRTLDEKMKLILAAAMTAVLQIKAVPEG